MENNRINGHDFELMFKNALNYFKTKESIVNDMNVFPVPDGDTGFNMRMTLENGVKNAKSDIHAGRYLKSFARGTLYGARGNSGVILSQLFRGFADELENDSIVDAYELVEGFRNGCIKAYEAVNNPKEGTLLTVLKDGPNGLDKLIHRGDEIISFFELYLKNIKVSVINTPNLLPILKESNVVDSGGLGYQYIIEGICKYFNNEIIEDCGLIDLSDNINTTNEYSYKIYLEFQLSNKKTYRREQILNYLSANGNKILFDDSNNKFKIEMNTNNPNAIMNFMQEYGEFINVKIDNTNDKYVEFSKNNTKEYSIIAIANGEGLINKYRELGCDYVIDGTNKMNTSTQEIIDAINESETDKCVLIVNNKNIVMAANLAKSQIKDKEIKIIETTNLMEGYYGILTAKSSSFDNIEVMFRNSLNALSTIQIFKSVRAAKIGGWHVKKDAYVGLCNNVALDSDKDILDCLMNSISNIDDIDYKTNIVIMKGLNCPLSDNEIIDSINDKYDYLEITIIQGDQGTYDCIVGII